MGSKIAPMGWMRETVVSDFFSPLVPGLSKPLCSSIGRERWGVFGWPRHSLVSQLQELKPLCPLKSHPTALSCSGKTSNASGSCHSIAFLGESPSSQEHQESQAACRKPPTQAVPHLVLLSSHLGSTTNLSPALQPPLLSHHAASPSLLTLPQAHLLPFSLLFPPRGHL